MSMASDEQENTSPSSSQLSASNVRPAWCTEPEIDAERQRCLANCLKTKFDFKKGIYPFKNIKLTRADIEWLLINHENGRGPVDWSDEKGQKRVGLDLRSADLRGLDLRNLPLVRMYGGLNRERWKSVPLEQRNRAAVHLEGADLSEAHLEGAILQGAHLEGATLRGAHLEGTNLFRAHLENAYLREAYLEQARLLGAHLEGAYLAGAHLDGADLRNAFLNSATYLEGVTLSSEKFGSVLLANVHWGDVDLSVVNWKQLKKLGDEYRACQREERVGMATAEEKGKRLNEYRAAVRANRQLANAMRTQGMNEEAIPFAYRAQILQRKVFWRQALWGEAEPLQANLSQGGIQQRLLDIGRRIRSFGACIFWWFLDILAGYGYKPVRTLLIYVLTILGFATCYYLIGHLSVPQALIFSVTSFHGRGFLPGPFPLGHPVTGFAASEAVIGLFIEISFIATFTQRFFGR